MTRQALLALALVGALGLGACGGDEQTGAPAIPTTTAGEPAQKAQVCFKAEPLQVLGGKSLAAIDEASEGGPPVGNGKLDAIVRGAFGPSLRAEFRRLAESDGESAQIIAAAQSALKRVKAEPALLLEKAALQSTFANAQRLAEDGGFSSPTCGS